MTQAFYCGTQIPSEPALVGHHGRAWQMQLPPIGRRATPDHDATVDAWIVQVPGAHPCWDHWIVSVIHLRDIPGVRPAQVRTPGASHELLIASLDPGYPLPSALDDATALHLLRPIDVAEQFIVANDAVAQQLLELALRAMVDGLASPDQDWRSWWSRALTDTARHFGDGTHTVVLS